MADVISASSFAPLESQGRFDHFFPTTIDGRQEEVRLSEILASDEKHFHHYELYRFGNKDAEIDNIQTVEGSYHFRHWIAHNVRGKDGLKLNEINQENADEIIPSIQFLSPIPNIQSDGLVERGLPTLSISGEVELEAIAVYGEGTHKQPEREIFGFPVFDPIESSGEFERGIVDIDVVGSSHLGQIHMADLVLHGIGSLKPPRIYLGKITSESSMVVDSFVAPSNPSLDEIKGFAAINAPFVVHPSNPSLSNIGYLRGRVISGFEAATVIEQIYEVSKDRTLDITRVPENSKYAIRLNTTRFNLTDDELNRGMVDLNFRFDFELDELHEIKVWIVNEHGNRKLDKLRIIELENNIRDDHIITDMLRTPRSREIGFRVPIHTISDKGNQFVLEISYRDYERTEDQQRSRMFSEDENILLPISADFDNQDPYINIGDSITPHMGVGAGYLSYETDNPEIETLNYFDEINPQFGAAAKAHLSLDSDYLGPTYYEVMDSLRAQFGANKNPYLKTEYDKLDIINIGG